MYSKLQHTNRYIHIISRHVLIIKNNDKGFKIRIFNCLTGILVRLPNINLSSTSKTG